MIFSNVTLKKGCDGVVVLHAITDCGSNFFACEKDTINAILCRMANLEHYFKNLDKKIRITKKNGRLFIYEFVEKK